MALSTLASLESLIRSASPFPERKLVVFISDGFFMMFKPLEPGPHTIVVRGTNVQGADKTFTYHLTIQ